MIGNEPVSCEMMRSVSEFAAPESRKSGNSTCEGCTERQKMKACSACKKHKPNEFFTERELRKKEKRMCEDCKKEKIEKRVTERRVEICSSCGKNKHTASFAEWELKKKGSRMRNDCKKEATCSACGISKTKALFTERELRKKTSRICRKCHKKATEEKKNVRKLLEKQCKSCGFRRSKDAYSKTKCERTQICKDCLNNKTS